MAQVISELIIIILCTLLVAPVNRAESGQPDSVNLQTTGKGSAMATANSLHPFTRVDNIAPGMDTECSFGVSWADYDGDNYPDLFVSSWWPGETRLNSLYHNNGNGTFGKILDQIPAQEGNALGAIWGDFDNDGDEDLFTARFIPRASGTNNCMYTNDGHGTFTKVTESPAVIDKSFSSHAITADFDNDGDLDLLVGNHCARVACEAFYYRNDAGNFARAPLNDIGLIAGDFGAVTAADIDGDGDLDFVHARNMLTSMFYLNKGDGSFASISNVVSADSTRAYCWGDYDNDGDFDLCAMNNWTEGPILYRNDGKGGFERLVLGLADSSLTAADGKPYWADYDNDGDLDLLIVNQGERYAPMPSVLFANTGDGSFARVANSVIESDSGASSGAAWADYDRDGDLDLYVARTNFGHNVLYRNEVGNLKNWLDVKCIGTSTNRSGIGAKIHLKAKINGKEVRQLRQISSQSGFFGQDEMRAHFGLGDAQKIDSLIIEWPGGGTDILANITSRQALTIKEGMTRAVPR